MAQLNISMDLHAKRRLRWLHNRQKSTVQYHIRNEGWSCTVDGEKITSDPGPAIRHHISGHELLDKLRAKGRLSVQAYEYIDWPAIAKMMQQAPTLYRLWVTKHVSGFFAHGVNMLRWKFWDHSCCPCCNAPREDKLHLLTCPAPAALDNWLAAIDRFHMWLEMVETSPPITACFIAALKSRNPHHAFATAGSTALQLAAAHQADIGWVNFTEGKIASAWGEIQQLQYRFLSSRRTAHAWTAGVVHQLLLLTHSQWSYRNSILHQRDAQGRLVRDTQEVHDAVTAHFDLGVDGLHPDDHHFLERGRPAVLTLPLQDARAWLSGIQIARQTYAASEAQSITAMQQVMANWLGQAG